MEALKTEQSDQTRWDYYYGTLGNQELDEHPERFHANPKQLPTRHMDLIQAIANIPGSEVLQFGSRRGEFAVALAKFGGYGDWY